MRVERASAWRSGGFAGGAVAMALTLTGCSWREATCRIEEGTPHAVRYVLAWDDGESMEGAPRTYTSDLGHAFTVSGGSIVDYSTQLVPCTDEERAPLVESACGTVLPSAVPPSVAPQGHGTSTIDGSAVTMALVEPLLGASFDFGQAVAHPQFYCRGHYLVGPATATVVDGMVGTSLVVEGSYVAAGGTDPVAFRFESASAFGGFATLEAEAMTPVLVDSGARSVAVTFERPRSRMFDGIDPTTASAEDAAKAVLRNLVRGTTARVVTE